MAEQPSSQAFTYEQLFDMLRAEKNSPNLQKLVPGIHQQIEQYLQDKEQKIVASFTSDNPFAQDDGDDLQTQLRNARRIVRMIYDLREKKILQMAMNKSRTSSSVIDTSGLNDSERELFKDVVAILDKYRHQELLPMIDKKTSPSTTQRSTPAPVQTEPVKEPSVVPRQDNLLIRILDDVPELVGPDLQKYGPFKPEDVAHIPKEVAQALVDSHKAQMIKPSV